MTTKNKKLFPQIQDSRSWQGIFARGRARYNGPGNAPRTGNVFDVRKAAKKRLRKMQDQRRFR